ncbi:putative formin-like protein 5 [Iris pallida]|uniref:Formin-like protein 5 n=1 Tax=Iris pallida TaxID=29817 RepID=A0AAX6EFR4_IRIPA|nr:putative formin-like protein 5 [Iris pallida]
MSQFPDPLPYLRLPLPRPHLGHSLLQVQRQGPALLCREREDSLLLLKCAQELKKKGLEFDLLTSSRLRMNPRRKRKRKEKRLTRTQTVESKGTRRKKKGVWQNQKFNLVRSRLRWARCGLIHIKIKLYI